MSFAKVSVRLNDMAPTGTKALILISESANHKWTGNDEVSML
jgi:hypothetical protein